jgi:predicted porin
MKKSLVALAVLAASGASFAQSSVTVYGVLDIWGGTVKDEHGVAAVAKNFFGTTGAVGSVTTTKLDSGGVSHDRWGFKGSEDLGGGLKANFNLEQGFSLDSGAADSSAQAFARYSWVGLSGGFGEIKLGKTATAFDDVNGASDAVFDSALSPMNHVFGSTAYNWTPPNTIMYVTPSMGGFAGELSYSLGENKTATTSATSITSVNLTYGAGPVAVQFGYQVEGVATGSDAKFTRLGGTYDFGVAKLYANYGKVTNVANVSGADTTDYQIGADYPVSAALTLSASYAKSDDNSTAGNQSRKGYGIAANYTLSKRTSIYGGYNSNSATNGAAGDDKLDILAVGIRHAF